MGDTPGFRENNPKRLTRDTPNHGDVPVWDATQPAEDGINPGQWMNTPLPSPFSPTFQNPVSDVAASENAGALTTLPRGDHVHAHGSGYLPDAHHNKSHVHLGDGSGTVAHTSLSGVSPDQHHAQNHTHFNGDGGNLGLLYTTCEVATTANLASLSGLLTIDGITLAGGERVLVKNQSTSTQNGIYIAAGGAWARASDMAVGATVHPNAMVPVNYGTANGDTLWMFPGNADAIVATNALSFVLLGANPGLSPDIAVLALANATGTINRYARADHAHEGDHTITGAFHTGFPGGTTTFLRADGTFAVPAGSGTEPTVSDWFFS
jgi:hypothetical protein